MHEVKQHEYKVKKKYVTFCSYFLLVYQKPKLNTCTSKDKAGQGRYKRYIACVVCVCGGGGVGGLNCSQQQQ